TAHCLIRWSALKSSPPDPAPDRGEPDPNPTPARNTPKRAGNGAGFACAVLGMYCAGRALARIYLTASVAGAPVEVCRLKRRLAAIYPADRICPPRAAQ